MMRIVLQYVLALGFILLQGFRASDANALDVNTSQEACGYYQASELSYCFAPTAPQLSLRHGLEAIEIEEEEEDRRSSNKKHLSNVTPFTALFYALYLGVFQDFEQTHSAFNASAVTLISQLPLFIAYSDYRL